MVRLLRHRQTKGAVTDRPNLRPPRHILTLLVEHVRDRLVTYLHKNPKTARQILKKIQRNERERKDLAGIKKLARERTRKANIHNKKLRDCKVHFNEPRKEGFQRTQLFITEGDSASGSLTKVRQVQTQAVFSLRGKPLNCFGLSRKVVYQNEELNLLQHALGIEDGIENLRYNQVILATDADVERWTPSVGPLGGISKVDSAVVVAASKGNSERGRA